MTSRFIACLSLSCATVFGFAACGAGTAGPPTAPTDPIGGAETADKTGYEPPGGSGDGTPSPGSTIPQLCAYDCMRFESICPGAADGVDCMPSCLRSVMNFPGCEAQYQSYLVCLASAPIACTNGTIDPSACASEIMAVSNCAGMSGGSGSGGGTAGTGGSAPPR